MRLISPGNWRIRLGAAILVYPLDARQSQHRGALARHPLRLRQPPARGERPRYGGEQLAARRARKMHRFRWYWRETWVQSAIWLLMFGALITYLVRLPGLRDIELGLVGWCAFHLFMLGGFVRRSWYGVNWRERLFASRTRQPEAAAIPIERGPAD